MNNSTRTQLFMSMGILAAFAAPTFATPLVGVNFDSGFLYDVDQTTGATSNPRNTSVTFLVDVAYVPDGTLYGMTPFITSGAPNSLYEIDPASGASTLVGPLGFNSLFEGDLAVQPGTGTLYGMQDVSNNPRALFTINTTTGAGTFIGNLPDTGDHSGMAFSPNGTLYVIDSGVDQSLYTINPNDGSVISSVGINVDLGSVVGFDFDPATGVAYVADGDDGGTDMLYTLNTTTGVLSTVGSLGLSGGLAGLSFQPTIPEPTTVTVLALAAGVGLMRRRRSVA